VYSLGALLYELLTGAPPFDPNEMAACTLGELLQILASREPSRPSAKVLALVGSPEDSAPRMGVDFRTHARRLRGDLDWIVAKAMSKEPDRRYGSPAELRADVVRHLRNEPVLAGPPSSLYQLGKFVRRHRAAVALSASLAILLVGFGTSATLQARRLAEERDRATREALQASKTATRLGRLARFMVGTFWNLAPGEPGLVITGRDVLSTATNDIYEGLEQEPAFSAYFLGAIAQAYFGYGDDERARSLEAQAESLLVGDAPEILEAKYLLAEFCVRVFRLETGERLASSLLATQRRLHGSNHPDPYRTERVLAWCYQRQRRYHEAEKLLASASEGLRRTLGATHPDTLRAAGQHGSLLMRLGHYDLADSALRQLVETRRAAGLAEDAAVLYNLACTATRMGEHDRALGHLRRSLELGFYYGGRRPDGTVLEGAAGILEDPDLLPLHDNPEFVAILRLSIG
jgi:tetratricopeptide (TPR) repeat protein